MTESNDLMAERYESRRKRWSLFTPNMSDDEIRYLRPYLFGDVTPFLSATPSGVTTRSIPRIKNFIAGSWEETTSYVQMNTLFDKRIPLFFLPDSGDTEVEKALSYAHAYWESFEWTRETVPYRKWVVQNFSRILNFYYEDVLRQIRLQIPKTRLEADKDFWEAKRAADHMAGAAETVMKREYSPSMIEGHDYWRNEFLPAGAAALITPMNFIYGIPVIQLIGCYLSGSPFILKGHPLSALANTTLIKMLLAAGANPRGIQKLEGFGSRVSRVATDRRVAVVSVTGSDETARVIQNGRGLRKLYFEGGGCNWVWIDDDCIPELATIAKRLTYAKLGFSSHKCTTLHGIGASRKVLDRLLPLLKEEFSRWQIKNPLCADDSETEVVGPSMVHLASNVTEIVASARNAGCNIVLAGGKLSGNEYFDNAEVASPAIIDGITPETIIEINWDGKGQKRFPLATTELFLPVLVTSEMSFETFISFCLVTNTHDLATSIYTKDVAKRTLAERTIGGMLKFNDGTDSALEWEEFGASGIGPSGNMGVGEAEATIKLFCRKQKGRYVSW